MSCRRWNLVRAQDHKEKKKEKSQNSGSYIENEEKQRKRKKQSTKMLKKWEKSAYGEGRREK